MAKTSYAEFRQIIAQVNDCALAFIGNEKYDISVSMVNFKMDEDSEMSTGVRVFIHSGKGVVENLSFANFSSEEENYAALKKLWDFVAENTEG